MAEKRHLRIMRTYCEQKKTIIQQPTEDYKDYYYQRTANRGGLLRPEEDYYYQRKNTTTRRGLLLLNQRRTTTIRGRYQRTTGAIPTATGGGLHITTRGEWPRLSCQLSLSAMEIFAGDYLHCKRPSSGAEKKSCYPQKSSVSVVATVGLLSEVVYPRRSVLGAPERAAKK